MNMMILMLCAKSSEFDWNPVMDAIIQIESEGNPKAVSGNSVGVMQITPILVEDCNNILQKQKSKKRFTLADRYSVEKSKEMFILTNKMEIFRIKQNRVLLHSHQNG